MEQKLSFSVKVTVKEMYFFLIRHIFTGISGWFGIAFGLVLILIAIFTRGSVPSEYTVLYVAIALFVWIYPFFNLYRRAKIQVNSDSLKTALDYEADGQGIAVVRGEDRAEFAWQDLNKVVETRALFIVYVNSVRAFLWSKEQIGGQCESLKKLMNEKLVPAQNKLKK